MLDRNHLLVGLQTKRVRQLFQRVDGRSVDARVTGFAQAPVARLDAKAGQQRLQRRRPAVHARSLDGFGCKEAAAELAGIFRGGAHGVVVGDAAGMAGAGTASVGACGNSLGDRG